MKNNKILNYFKIIVALLLLFSGAYFIYINRGALFEMAEMQTNDDKVFPNLSRQLPNVSQIKITTPQQTILLNRKANDWLMENRSDYKLSRDYLSEFITIMDNLKRKDFISDNPSLFNVLNVGDNGNLIEFYDSEGNLISGSYIGQNGDIGYVRGLQDNKIYSTDKIEFDFNNIAAWLGLNFLNIAPQDIIAAQITQNDQTIELKRDQSGDFITNFQSRFSGKNATAISHISLNDVAPENKITQSPILSQIIILQSGDKLKISLYNQYNIYWLKITALSQSDFAARINQKSHNQAFAISKSDAQIFID